MKTIKKILILAFPILIAISTFLFVFIFNGLGYHYYLLSHPMIGKSVYFGLCPIEFSYYGNFKDNKHLHIGRIDYYQRLSYTYTKGLTGKPFVIDKVSYHQGSALGSGGSFFVYHLKDENGIISSLDELGYKLEKDKQCSRLINFPNPYQKYVVAVGGDCKYTEKCKKVRLLPEVVFHDSIPTNEQENRDIINNIKVPEKPDEILNSMTLKGVDINQNDIRDDVERRIAEVFYNEPKRIEINMFFQSLSRAMNHLDHESLLTLFNRHACLKRIDYTKPYHEVERDVKDFEILNSKIADIILLMNNTSERKKRFEYVAGSEYEVPTCDILYNIENPELYIPVKWNNNWLGPFMSLFN